MSCRHGSSVHGIVDLVAVEISGDVGQVVEFPVLVFPEFESKKRFINLNGKLFDVETNFYGNGLHVFRQCTKPGWTSQEMVVYFFLNKKKEEKRIHLLLHRHLPSWMNFSFVHHNWWEPYMA